MMSATVATRKRGGALGFWALIATQTQGAFSDNAFKLIIVLALPSFALGLSPERAEWIEGYGVFFSLLLFTLPWVLFPGFAGFLSDKFTKSRVIIWTKIWELCVMAVGLLAFINENVYLLFGMLFMMSMQSAFFQPREVRRGAGNDAGNAVVVGERRPEPDVDYRGHAGYGRCGSVAGCDFGRA
jgi:hypothetical protein